MEEVHTVTIDNELYLNLTRIYEETNEYDSIDKFVSKILEGQVDKLTGFMNAGIKIFDN